MKNPIHQADRELAKWRNLKVELKAADLDDETLRDTLEGATNLHEALLAIDETIIEDEALAIGLKAQIEKLCARATRLANRIERKRTIIADSMIKAGIKQVKGANATISLSHRAPKMVVINEALVPEKWWKRQDPKLDKVEITRILNAGEKIPGVTLDNGAPQLTIRR